MGFKKWKVHTIIACVDCGKEFDNYLTATKDASKHHRKTGHKITGEIGYAVEWR